MNPDGLMLLLIAAVGVGFVLWFHRNQNRRASDLQLSEWLNFLVKTGTTDSPEQKPKITTSQLPATAYETIKKFCNPKLRAEYDERLLRLENEIAARAIQIELASRRMSEGKGLSEYDDAILIREKLRNGDSKNALVEDDFEMAVNFKRERNETENEN